jgi:hypothetical protein
MVSSNVDVFGFQPFLAIRTMDNRYLHDNFDCEIPRRSWNYTFDLHTIELEAVQKIAVAANCANGTTCVSIVDRVTGQIQHTLN